MARTSTPVPTSEWLRQIKIKIRFSNRIIWFVILKLTYQQQISKNWNYNLWLCFLFCTNSDLMTLRGFLESTSTLWKEGEKSKALCLMRIFLKKNNLWRTFSLDDSICIFISFLFFYCKSLFDCWKNQVIQGIKSHHEPDLEQRAEINFF